MTRAFVAIRPPDAVLEAIEARVGSVPVGPGRAPPREQWHLTVQFLGDDADVDAVASALSSAPLGPGPGTLRLDGAVALGNPRRARIVALGLREGAEWMRTLAAHVGERLAPLGYTR